MSEWKEVSLGEILQVKYGKDHKKVGKGNIPIYGSGGIMRKGNLCLYDKPSVLIPRKGTLSNIFYVDCPFWTVDTMFWTIIDTKRVLPKFLFYAIKDYKWDCLNVGSAVPSLTVPVIDAVQINLPPIEQQQEISSILSSLDDKIAVNRRICQNLEEQAQALFKHWFVDFAPFKDGKFVESELGMIPEGWRVGTIADIASQITQKVGEQEGIKVLSPINTGQLVLSDEFFTKQVYSKSIAKYIIVKPKDFAYNPARVNIGSIGMNEFGFDGCVSPVYVVFRCNKGFHYYLDMIRQSSYFKKNVQKLAIGGVRQTLRYDDLARIPLVIPPSLVVNQYNSFHEQTKQAIQHYAKEIQNLATLRDTLLPKLMSGQIKI